MEKTIRTELWKMTGMIVALIGLGIYARDFVLAGLQAKLALNLSIFILAGCAAAIAFRHVLSLKNEVVAMKALQTDYGLRSRRPRDPLARPAMLFDEPELLGQSYRLITEELGKQDDLKVSSGTVQTLLHEIDQRINDRKSSILYFSGLMVFLGLLGAFMGLMKTVHSVSDLIGSMDMSGKGGSDAFGKMIEGMKAPLAGMSVGFSSSLFGLMTSMVLGALERCMSAAMKALRNEFEHWLSNVAALEGAAEGSAGADMVPLGRALEASVGELRDLRELIGESVRTAAQTRMHIDQLALAMRELSYSVAQVADPTPLLTPLRDTVSHLAASQLDMVAQFKGLYDVAEQDRVQIRGALAAIAARSEHERAIDPEILHDQLDRIVAYQAELAERPPADVAPTGHIVFRHPPGRVSRWLSSVVTLVRVAIQPRAGQREARRLRRDLRTMLEANRRAMLTLGRGIDRRLAGIEAGEAEDRAAIARLSGVIADQQARLDTLAEQLGPAAGDGLSAEYHGARAELAQLRQRLGVRFEAATVTPPPAAAPRLTGTEG